MPKDEEVCPITQRPADDWVMLEVCHHKFDKQPLLKWTQERIARGNQYPPCPICRTPYCEGHIKKAPVVEKPWRDCCGMGGMDCKLM